ncbi:MLO-like protein 10 [Silene latifolia]|uniref:MLO-like protein 10 n=1 Tax=Silene latifolia TaxID=37657 RepID=UPI003D77AE0B
MSGGSSEEGRTLDQTPTWAVAGVCAFIVLISFFLENALHALGTLLKKKQKAALYEALDKVKGELMILGFISLLLTFTQGYVCRICVPSSVAQIMLPCTLDTSKSSISNQKNDRRLLSSEEQNLATTCFNYKCKESTFLIANVSAHIAPGRKFDFRKYIKRSLEDDFKVVVGVGKVRRTLINLKDTKKETKTVLLLNLCLPRVNNAKSVLWASFVIFLLLNVNATQVVQGIPLVQGSDTYFWFSQPRLILHLLHFSLFRNAFQITYFLWILCDEFGLNSCFHDTLLIEFIKITIGIGAMVTCDYSILPLYALVSQMGSHMKKVIFDEQMSKALKKWQKAAKKKQSANDKTPIRTLGGEQL